MRRTTLAITIGLTAWLAGSTPAAAQCPTATGPDVIVGDLQDLVSYGSVGGISAFAVGTTSCNVGTEALLWSATTPAHPVIAQNLYRRSNGILEQVGQSWLKHGFFAVSDDLCCPGQCIGTAGDTLGVGCSDPYTASRNGTQSNLGPRSQVNPHTGVFPFPFSGPPAPAVIGRRLQVPDTFLADSTGSVDVAYYAEGHYVAPDDAAAGNGLNNASNRRIDMVENGAEFIAALRLGEATHREETAIERWAAEDPGVNLSIVDLASDGRLFVASKVIALPSGEYHYEYAIYNMNADDAVGHFQLDLPVAVNITAPGFHAVHHHSLEPIPGMPSGQTYSNDAWDLVQSPGLVAWSTEPWSGDPTLANPIRWGTMYNFRFTTDSPPIPGSATLRTWKTETDVLVGVQVPTDDFVPAVVGLECQYDLIANGTTLTWENAEDYDALEVRRDGALLATLAGDETSYFDGYDDPGTVGYSVTGIFGPDQTIPAACSVAISDVPLGFQLRATDSTIFFSDSTGQGAGTVALTLQEDPDNPAFPHAIAGFAFALTYDPDLVTPTGVVAGSSLGTPDFFAAEILEVGGLPTGGITVGTVMSLDFSSALLADTEVEVARLTLATNATAVIGATDPIVTELRFENGVHGPIPISAVVSVETTSYAPNRDHGRVTLEPGSGPLFVRGDVNGDGQVQISDAVFGLGYLFQGQSVQCESAIDMNDDGAANIADVVYGLDYLFQSGPTIPSPFPGCGVDPTPDSLTCMVGSTCP